MNLLDALEEYSDFKDCVGSGLPEAHRDHLEDFQRLSNTDLVISFCLQPDDDFITLRLRSDGCDVEYMEMIDFPQATICLSEADWDYLRDGLLKLGRRLQKKEGVEKRLEQVEITTADLDALTRLDGVFEVVIGDLIDGEQITVELILNDYVSPPGASRCEVHVQWDELLEAADHAGKGLSSILNLEGDMSLAMEVGGLLLERFPQLEGVWRP
jgi:hypothetical protein